MSQGSAALLSYGLETAEGAGGTQKTFMRIENESLQMTRVAETNPNMDPTNLETEPVNLLADGKGKIKSAPDVNTMVRMRVHHRGFDTISTPVAGVSRHTIRNVQIGDPAMTPYVDSLFFDLWKDDGVGQLLLGAKCDEMDFVIAQNKFISLEHGFQFARDSEMGDPIPTGSNNVAYTGRVVFRGHRGDPESLLGLKMKVLVGGALDGTAKVTFTKGVVAYGAVQFAVVAGVPIKVVLADGTTTVGDDANHEDVQAIFYPALPGDVLTIGDEWTVNQPRPEAVPTYSTAQVLNAVGAQASITLNGVTKTYAIHSLSGKYIRPRKLNMGLGTKYAFGVLNNGRESMTYTFQRDYTDRDFYNALVANRVATISIPIYGNKIGVTTYQEKWQLDTTFAKVSVAGSVVSVPTVLPESVTIRAYTNGTAPLLQETIDCTVPAL